MVFGVGLFTAIDSIHKEMDEDRRRFEALKTRKLMYFFIYNGVEKLRDFPSLDDMLPPLPTTSKVTKTFKMDEKF